MNEAIRLTNRTAIALRRNARRVRTAHAVAAAILTVLLAAAAVLLGLRWLPAVPLTVALTVLLDCAIMLRARSRYLSLIGQAICTEAAAQEIRAGRSEQTRRARAINDLMDVKADMQRGAVKADLPDAKPFFERSAAQSDAPETEEGGALTQKDESSPPRRRRRQNSLQLIRTQQAK